MARRRRSAQGGPPRARAAVAVALPRGRIAGLALSSSLRSILVGAGLLALVGRRLRGGTADVMFAVTTVEVARRTGAVRAQVRTGRGAAARHEPLALDGDALVLGSRATDRRLRALRPRLPAHPASDRRPRAAGRGRPQGPRDVARLGARQGHHPGRARGRRRPRARVGAESDRARSRRPTRRTRTGGSPARALAFAARFRRIAVAATTHGQLFFKLRVGPRAPPRGAE